MPVFYSQMGHLSISSAAFCRYLHISFLVLYISEKVPVGILFYIQSGVIALVILSFLFYYAERATHLILNITHRTLPSALYAFPQPARPFLTGLKEYTPLLHAP